MYIISNPFFENQPNEICSYLSKKASKGRFLKSEKLQIHSNEGKGEEKKKDRGERKKKRRKKSNSCTLRFIIATLEKKTVGRKGPFGDNIVKNPAAVAKMKSKVQPGCRLFNR